MDLWGLINRMCMMAAAANVLWSLLPQLLLLVPDSHKVSENMTTISPVSSLTHRPFSKERRLQLREDARRMFYWGYDNYMHHAFPDDELNPINCSGRGHDWEDLSNTNINDVLGDYSLTLVDTLDTLAIMGNTSEFKRATQLVLQYVSFERCTTVQVFEATIRVLGALLSAHLLIQDPAQPLGSISPQEYSGELLELAHDLGARLLLAFENTTTGLPHPRVNLCYGVPADGTLETCTAGAGTLTVEFTLLSRLLGDPVYESLARRSTRALWERRHKHTGLVGNVINIQTGQWTGRMSGLGAGIDSFYEYLLKSYILFGEREDLEMFNEMYQSVMRYLKRGRSCRDVFRETEVHNPPYYVNVDYATGRILNYWVDSLSASFAGVQVLAGDLEEAICTHAFHYSIWRRYKAMPERFNWQQKASNVHFYPLRPELVESTYLLYQATHNPFYLHVGRDILESLERHAKAKCGYATLHNVVHKTHEDRMESFFLSETCKYLFLLFDTENVVNRHASDYLFTTEGHLIRLDPTLRERVWKKESRGYCGDPTQAIARTNESFVTHSCSMYAASRRYTLPLTPMELGNIEALVGLYGNTNT